MPIANIPPFDPSKHGWITQDWDLHAGISPSVYQKMLSNMVLYLHQNQWYGADFDLQTVRDILGEYNKLYKDLWLAGQSTVETTMEWDQYRAKLDYMLTQHAVRMNELYAEWESAARSAARQHAFHVATFGVPVEAGVGEAGKAYYAPEVWAPYPGFDVQTIGQLVDNNLRYQKIHEMQMSFTFDKITEVTEETRTKIMSAVSQFRMNGGSTHDVMQYVTGVLGIKPEKGTYWSTIGTLSGVTSKAENIFRTEIMASQNMETRQMIEEMNKKDPDLKLRQMWMATGDARTRDTHLAAHGQVVDADLPFDVGGYVAWFPGDPRLPPEERCRCRCRPVPWRNEWGDPDVVLGDVNRKVAAERERRRLEKEGKLREKNPERARPSNSTLSGRALADSYESGLNLSGNMAPVVTDEDRVKYDNDPNSVHPDVRNYLQTRQFLLKGNTVSDLGTQTVQSEAKDKIVSELSRRAGIHYDHANRFIKQWAISSNGSDMRSLSIQESAAKLFGDVELSDWQKKEIKKLNAIKAEMVPKQRDLYNQLIANGLDDFDAASQSLDAWGYSNPQIHYSLFENPETGQVWGDLAAAGFTSGSEVEMALLQSMYDYTQEQLAAAGIREVLLMRGEVRSSGMIASIVEGENFTMHGNALASYAPSRVTANAFARNAMDGETAMVTGVNFPAERIIGTARTGFGCLNEWEFVVLGGGVEDEATLLYKNVIGGRP